MQKDKLKILKLNPDYIERLVFLENEYFGQPWSYQNFVDDLNNKFSINFVCLYENQVIGYINGNLIFEQGCINKILICKEFWQKNIGSFLLNYFIDYVKQKNCETIDLEVRKSNFKAINFYKKFDFQIISERKNFYQNPVEDAFLMQKN